MPVALAPTLSKDAAEALVPDEAFALSVKDTFFKFPAKIFSKIGLLQKMDGDVPQSAVYPLDIGTVEALRTLATYSGLPERTPAARIPRSVADFHGGISTSETDFLQSVPLLATIEGTLEAIVLADFLNFDDANVLLCGHAAKFLEGKSTAEMRQVLQQDPALGEKDLFTPETQRLRGLQDKWVPIEGPIPPVEKESA